MEPTSKGGVAGPSMSSASPLPIFSVDIPLDGSGKGVHPFDGTPSSSSPPSGSTGSPTTTAGGAMGRGGGGGSSPSTASPSPAAAADVTGAYPHCPVFILSKGRADQERGTMATLVRDLVPFTVVVEPGEVVDYCVALDRLVERFFGAAGMVHPDVYVVGEVGEGGEYIIDMEQDVDKREEGEGEVGWGGGGGGVNNTSSSSANDHTATAAGTSAQSLPPPTGNGGGKVEEGYDDGDGANCVCCEHPAAAAAEETVQGSEIASSTLSPTAAPAANATVTITPADLPHSGDAVTSASSSSSFSFAERMASVYHHGYVYLPLTATASESAATPNGGSANEIGGEGALNAAASAGEAAVPSSPASRCPGRRRPPAPRFVLRTVEEIRQLFAVAALPEANRGVSYVRNFILHVLVPQLMVGSGIDSEGHLDEINLFSAGEARAVHDTVLRSLSLEPSLYAAMDARAAAIAAPPAPPHVLYGHYWVMDDDIYSFFRATEDGKRNVRISPREALREVGRRIARMRRCSLQQYATDPSAIAAAAALTTKMAIFTCREDVLQNNPISLPGQSANTASTSIQTRNYPFFPLTACYSLEYCRFGYSYDDDAIAINSYNNIACLFNYNLVHGGSLPMYYPTSVTAGIRSAREALVGYGGGPGMMWYRFAIREDYDFTLQLIARGLLTVRFRNLSFDVPQMSKVRGGMTDYYKNCQDEIREQNKRFLQQWPAIAQHWVKGKNSTERDDIRIRWDLLHPARARYPGAFLYLNQPLPQLQPQRRPDQAPTAPAIDVYSIPLPHVVKEEREQHSSPLPVAAKEGKVAPKEEGEENEEDHKGGSLNGGEGSPISSLSPPPPLTSVPTTATTTTTTSAGPRAVKRSRSSSFSSSSSSSSGSAFSSSTTSIELEEGARYADGHGPSSSHAETPTTTTTSGAEAVAPAAAAATTTATASLSPPPLPVMATSGSQPPVMMASGGTGWKGYAVERWRDISVVEAEQLGLHHLDPATLRAGQTVAVIPPLFSQTPSVVLATLIEKSVTVKHSLNDDEEEGRQHRVKEEEEGSDTHVVTWTAVPQKVRGMPLLSVRQCYAPPEQGLAQAAALVDAFFAQVVAPHRVETTARANNLLDE